MGKGWRKGLTKETDWEFHNKKKFKGVVPNIILGGESEFESTE